MCKECEIYFVFTRKIKGSTTGLSLLDSLLPNYRNGIANTFLLSLYHIVNYGGILI